MMRKSFISITIMLLLFLVTLLMTYAAKASTNIEKAATYDIEIAFDTETIIKNIYGEIKGSEIKPDYNVFRKALIGYYHLKSANKLSDQKDYLTIVDFSLSSNKERLWIIDLKKKEILFHSLVAHGRNTGEEYAANFSNLPNSFMSSIGFYVTGEIYHGKHGLSLRLDGQEKEFNSEARQRAVVMHGAAYVSKDFIKKAGRLGRSLGCPAVPVEIHKEVISALADKTCLFIYHPDKSYEEKSSFKNEAILANLLF